MKVVLAALLVAALAVPAVAGEECDIPVIDWQPRETLRSQLASAGWTLIIITARDGCYEARGTHKAGHLVAASFNPKTLEPIGPPHSSDQGQPVSSKLRAKFNGEYHA